MNEIKARPAMGKSNFLLNEYKGVKNKMKQLGQFEINAEFHYNAYRFAVYYHPSASQFYLISDSRYCHATEKLALQAGERALRELIAAGNEALNEVGE
jgi:hypothetical protein